MPLTNAERQKRWRERQKEKNRDLFLEKERVRKKASYVPHEDLSVGKLNERRKKCRQWFRDFYQRQKARETEEETELLASTSKVTTRSKKAKETLTVKLNLPKKATGVQKKYRRALRDAYRKIQFIEGKCEKLLKEKRSLQKRNLRAARQADTPPVEMSTTSLSSETTQPTPKQMTPKSKTKFILRKAGIQFNRKNSAHRELFLGNVIIASMKASISRKRVKSATSQMSAEILKKYRCVKGLSKSTGISRKKLSNINRSRTSLTQRMRYGEQVRKFLEREDNSVLQPGKRDTKTVNKKINQKYVLNDYMKNLWEKFQLENPNVKLSRSQFCKLRPLHILPTSYASRRTCLCTYHQNFTLKIKAMKRYGFQSTSHPDTFLKEFKTDDSLKAAMETQLSEDEIKFKHWKRVQDGEKYRWKEIEETTPKEDFIALVLKEFSAFRSHVERVQNQYKEMRRLRDNLPDNEILVWMDFAENYCCTSVEEVQSAYWNTEMISLHTMVVYFPKSHFKEKQSFVAVSECLEHNAAAVKCILQKCIPLLKEECPSLNRIHYLTDSPTSQYRNKTIFQMICNHFIEFGLYARWNYLETGHGKGPCDGLGASVKRSADMSVKQQKSSIQGSSDFMEWAVSAGDTSKVRYISYSGDDVKRVQESLSSMNKPLPIPGTMKAHAAVAVNEFCIALRELTCNCAQCLESVTDTQCSGWTKHHLYKKVNAPLVSDKDARESTNLSSGLNDVAVEDWVAAIYEGDWFIGKVTDVDTEDLQINFLTKAGKYGSSYKFPTRRDEIWVDRKSVLTVLHTVTGIGKTQRCFSISDKERDQVVRKFEIHSAN